MTSFSPFRKVMEHFSMVIGLGLAAVLVLWLEAPSQTANGLTLDYARTDPFSDLARVERLDPAVPGVLTAADIDAARTAWAYFENFTNEATGLSNSVETFPSGTMWDQGSYLMAVLSAYRLGLITREQARSRTERVFDALLEMPLVEGQLPNKVYNTDTLQMTFYNNTLAPNGLGWSALDITRLSVALFAATRQFQEISDKGTALNKRWNVNLLVSGGELIGAARDPAGNLENLQEGRLGYEEYGARGAALLGLNASLAADWRHNAIAVRVEGIPLIVDFRDKENSNASNYMLSEPFLLSALEFGLDPSAQLVATALYQTQARRAKRTGQLTAVTEDNIDQDPYFLYYSAYANGSSWIPLNPDGKAYPELATVSTKAAFGWHALFETDYTQSLIDYVGKTRHESRGWRSGIYEASGEINDVATANTNAMVLLSIHYQAFGPIIPALLRSSS